jgi:hypothetical protein
VDILVQESIFCDIPSPSFGEGNNRWCPFGGKKEKWMRKRRTTIRKGRKRQDKEKIESKSVPTPKRGKVKEEY